MVVILVHQLPLVLLVEMVIIYLALRVLHVTLNAKPVRTQILLVHLVETVIIYQDIHVLHVILIAEPVQGHLLLVHLVILDIIYLIILAKYAPLDVILALVLPIVVHV